MSLSWYINRIRSMTAPEVAHRLREKALKLTARRRLEGWDLYLPIPVHSPFTPLAPGLSSACPDLRTKILHAADLAVSGGFVALGRDWPTPTDPDPYPETLWTLDPVTGKQWTGVGRFCFDIPYRHERTLGDVKYVWERNRLQFLQPLAAAALISDDPIYLRTAERIVLSWVAANPPFRGLVWASGIEVALRAISLLVLMGLIGDRLSDQVRDAIGSVLHAGSVANFVGV